tara:strand:- start:1172 stop:1762 length:591 start_codon:yes stop_codon:yes gene_type:complete
MNNTAALTQTLEVIKDDTKGQKIDVAELVEVLNSRGFGPLLVGPAIIIILPTGAIPGMPSICALLIIFVSAQILMGRSQPWIPKSLKSFSFSREKFLEALSIAKPYAQKIDKLIYPRFKFLIQDSLKPIIAIISILLSIAIMILGFIPFAAALPASGILLLGLGLTARDGLLFAISFIICIGSLALLPYGYSAIFG